MASRAHASLPPSTRRQMVESKSVTLTSVEPRSPSRLVATLVMTSREVATYELVYSMDVGFAFAVRDGLVTRKPHSH
jgi:hypothetical protein